MITIVTLVIIVAVITDSIADLDERFFAKIEPLKIIRLPVLAEGIQWAADFDGAEKL